MQFLISIMRCKLKNALRLLTETNSGNAGVEYIELGIVSVSGLSSSLVT